MGAILSLLLILVITKNLKADLNFDQHILRLPEYSLELSSTSNSPSLKQKLEVELPVKIKSDVLMLDSVNNYLFTVEDQEVELTGKRKFDFEIGFAESEKIAPGVYYVEFKWWSELDSKLVVVPLRVYYDLQNLNDLDRASFDKQFVNPLSVQQSLDNYSALSIVDVNNVGSGGACQPLKNGCKLQFKLNLPAYVRVSLYSGPELVATLIEEEEKTLDANVAQTIEWNALWDNLPAPTGVYTYVIEAYHPRFGITVASGSWDVDYPQKEKADRLLFDLSEKDNLALRVSQPSDVAVWISKEGELITVVDHFYLAADEIYSTKILEKPWLQNLNHGVYDYQIVAQNTASHQEIAFGKLDLRGDKEIWYSEIEQSNWSRLGGGKLDTENVALLQSSPLFWDSYKFQNFAIDFLNLKRGNVDVKIANPVTAFELRSIKLADIGLQKLIWDKDKVTKILEHNNTAYWIVTAVKSQLKSDDVDQTPLFVDRNGFLPITIFGAHKVGFVADEQVIYSKKQLSLMQNSGLLKALQMTENPERILLNKQGLLLLATILDLKWPTLFELTPLVEFELPDKENVNLSLNEKRFAELLTTLFNSERLGSDGILQVNWLADPVSELQFWSQNLKYEDFYRAFVEMLLQQERVKAEIVVNRNAKNTCFENIDYNGNVNLFPYLNFVCENLQSLKNDQIVSEVTFAELVKSLQLAQDKKWW